MQALSSFFASLNYPLIGVCLVLWGATFAGVLFNFKNLVKRYIVASPIIKIVLAVLFTGIWAIPFLIDWKSGLVLSAICFTVELLIVRLVLMRVKKDLRYVDVRSGSHA